MQLITKLQAHPDVSTWCGGQPTTIAQLIALWDPNTRLSVYGSIEGHDDKANITTKENPYVMT